ncbi:MAG: type II toxin-antitoxin system HicB family antitoxin [Candidatus Bathyarchaeia archaeon]
MAQEILLRRGSTETSPTTVNFNRSEVTAHPHRCFRVILKRGLNGWIVAKCPDVKGAVTQGKDVNEALRNIIEAVSAILEDIHGEVVEFSILPREEE